MKRLLLLFMASVGAMEFQVGEMDFFGDISVVFCNGVANTEEDAGYSAGHVSKAFGGRRVFCKHNPTPLMDLVSFVVGDYIPYLLNSIRDRYLFHEQDTVRGLADRIVAEVERFDIERVVLFVHSHGVLIAQKALRDSRLDWLGREKIEVHAFAGAMMLSNELADYVCNYVCGRGLVSNIANFLFHDSKTIEVLRELRAGATPEDAARNIVMYKLGEEDFLASGEELYREYLEIAKKYNVELIPSTGSYLGDHSFMTFLPVIEKIAYKYSI